MEYGIIILLFDKYGKITFFREDSRNSTAENMEQEKGGKKLIYE